MPSGYSTRDTASIYQPLLDVLTASQEDEVVLTFKEIAAMIGRALPESAILRSGWWTSKGHHHVALWQAIGWRARAERDHLRVRFTRAVPEDPA